MTHTEIACCLCVPERKLIANALAMRNPHISLAYIILLYMLKAEVLC